MEYLTEQYIEEDQEISDNASEGVKFMLLAAENGLVEAKYQAGKIFQKGYHMDPDLQKSLQFFEEAAEENHVLAQYEAGMSYLYGTDIDYRKAFQYFFKAAKNGNSNSFYQLGFMYEMGYINKVNYEKAIKMYELASRGGHEMATIKLGLLYYSEKGKPRRPLIDYFTSVLTDDNYIKDDNIGDITLPNLDKICDRCQKWHFTGNRHEIDSDFDEPILLCDSCSKEDDSESTFGVVSRVIAPPTVKEYSTEFYNN